MRGQVPGKAVWFASGIRQHNGSGTELGALDGCWIWTVSGRPYGLRNPAGIAADRGHVWVAGDPQAGSGQLPPPWDGSVTELDARTGGLVRILSGP